MSIPDLVLASTSVYRKTLLEKIQIPFHCVAPQINETPIDNETAEQLVQRLALEKAKAVAVQHPNSWVIGSDQVCTINGQIVGKPGTESAAIHQLQAAAGQRITFFTGLCLYDAVQQRYQLCAEFQC